MVMVVVVVGQNQWPSVVAWWHVVVVMVVVERAVEQEAQSSELRLISRKQEHKQNSRHDGHRKSEESIKLGKSVGNWLHTAIGPSDTTRGFTRKKETERGCGEKASLQLAARRRNAFAEGGIYSGPESRIWRGRGQNQGGGL